MAAGAVRTVCGPAGPISGGTEEFGCTAKMANKIANDTISPHSDFGEQSTSSATAVWRYRIAGIDSLTDLPTGAAGSFGSSRKTARIVATALHNPNIRRNHQNQDIRQNRYSLPRLAAEIPS
jgi:hypothetical protein